MRRRLIPLILFGLMVTIAVNTPGVIVESFRMPDLHIYPPLFVDGVPFLGTADSHGDFTDDKKGLPIPNSTYDHNVIQFDDLVLQPLDGYQI